MKSTTKRIAIGIAMISLALANAHSTTAQKSQKTRAELKR